ncbi:MAG TPA: pentapeptide repeat-containing protein, partial [Methanothrix sp.]|nr:pentapeptide repeat-containing protein [Methanothrix sp.]
MRVHLLFAVLLILLTTAGAAPASEVLLLNSYNPGMAWTDDVTNGVRLRLAIDAPDANLTVEYMDSKKVQLNESRMEFLKRLYAERYGDRQFDVIISSDDDAFRFLLKNRDELFPGVPVVFCGVKDFRPEMLSNVSGFTGVLLNVSIEDTIALMLRLHPSADKIVVVNDNTTTGRANRRILEGVIPKFNLTFEVLDNVTADELCENVSRLGPDALVLLLTFNRDRAGGVFTYEESAELLRQASPVPVYGVWKMCLGHGIVGGNLSSGKAQGGRAAEIAARILRGADPDSIPIIDNSPNVYMFDMVELRRFSISPGSLPAGSIIINQPFHDRADLSHMNLSWHNMSGASLNQTYLNGSDLSGSNLTGAYLRYSMIYDANLSLADLSGADIEGADIHNTDLREARLRGAKLIGVNMIGSDLSRADLTEAEMENARLSGATLVGARMDGADLNGTKMEGCNLSGAFLRNAFVYRATLRDANLSGVNMSSSDLNGIDLTRASLRYSDLRSTSMQDSVMRDADLTSSKLTGAVMMRSNISGANLSFTDLSNTDMRRCCMLFTDLRGANLSGARLDSSM